MADYTQAQVTAGLAVVIAAVSDIGVVVTDQRTAEEDAEVLTLIESLNTPTNEPHGCSIVFQRLAEVPSGGVCEVRQTLSYKIELFYPYQRRGRSDGTTSSAAVAVLVGALAAALRESMSLGLDNRVRHTLLQSSDDLVIAHFEGIGTDTREIHFGRFSLDVENTVFY